MANVIHIFTGAVIDGHRPAEAAAEVERRAAGDQAAHGKPC